MSFGPEADLQAGALQKRVILWLERRFIRQADAVIAVTPPIARQLEKLYDLNNVVSVPNAEPVQEELSGDLQPTTFPIKFLLQGRAKPGRGIEKLLEGWEQIEDDRAVLLLRIPENPYFLYLQERFQAMIEAGRVIVVPPVAEDDLIRAASRADVGVIPYGGPSLNHIYACPNKLSQYMQAGLAILHNADQEFVAETINNYQNGLSYNTRDHRTLIDSVEELIDHPETLRKMRQHSLDAARSAFNWGCLSVEYTQTIKRLFERNP